MQRYGRKMQSQVVKQSKGEVMQSKVESSRAMVVKYRGKQSEVEQLSTLKQSHGRDNVEYSRVKQVG